MGEETSLSNKETSRCFVIMPFKQELYYFFLYIQLYVETEFGITCERGDTQGSTKTIENKVVDKISGADVVIADCTGENANVYFELGIAVKAEREVILIMQEQDGDNPKLPLNINNRDVLSYNFHSHERFIEKLHKMLYDILHPNPLALLYARYKAWGIREGERSNKPLNLLGEDEFRKLLDADLRAAQGPGRSRRELVLPEILDPQNSMPWDEIKRLVGGTTH